MLWTDSCFIFRRITAHWVWRMKTRRQPLWKMTQTLAEVETESRIPHEQDSEVKVSWHSRRPTVSHVVTPPFFCHIYCSIRTQTPWHVPVPDGGGLKKLPRHETDKNRCAAEAKMTRCLICKSGGDEALRRSCRLVVKVTVHIKKTQKSFWRTTVAVPATKPLIGYNRATENDQIKN